MQSHLISKLDDQCFSYYRKEKSHLEDLPLHEEEVKYKNLPPRERMRIRKMQQADQEAQRLK